jgi:hypothetical protein
VQPVNRVEFVIAPFEYGVARRDGVEATVDGVSVYDLFKRADGEGAYAPMSPVAVFLASWRRLLEAGGGPMQLLGCTCGDMQCSAAGAQVVVAGDRVVWSDFGATSPRAGAPGPRAYGDIGPFRFGRADYEAALAAPRRASRAVREEIDPAPFAAGSPNDPRAWLDAMTLAFGRDFLTPSAAEPTRAVARAGLRALRGAGQPMTDEAVRAWALHRRFAPEAVERYVAYARALDG